MIEFFKMTPKGWVSIDKPQPKCWINVSNPSEHDVKVVKSIVNVPKDLLLSLRDINEIPCVEHYKKFTFIIIKTPFNNIHNDYEYSAVPVGIIITKDMVITFSYFENDAIPKLKTKKFPFRRAQLVFRLLMVSARLYLSYLTEMNDKMNALENHLEQSQRNKIIMDLLEIEKSLVRFSTSLRSNEILLERIIQERILIKKPEDEKLIHRVLDENKQAIEMTYTYSNILSNTLDAFASIISNNLNIVMKVLASITILLALPTLVASIYGMNIELPYQHHPHAFAIVMGISLLTSAVALLFLWKNNYF